MKLKFLQLFFSAIGLLLALPSFAVQITSTPDRTVISDNETLQLSVRVDEQVGFSGPDFSLLESHFEILNQHRSDQFRSINGRTEQWTEWTLVLAPKSSGKLLIPSFNYQGAISDAVEITVNPAGTLPPGEVEDVFVEMEIDKEEIYVQEQVLVTYRIFSALQVREITLQQALKPEDTNIDVVSESNFRRTINGKTFRVYEIIYAIHPQKSQPINIPVLTWNLVTAGSRATWFNDPLRSTRGQVRRLRTDERTINVKPVPANYSGVNWMPAAKVELEQHWSSSPDRFVVGEPISRTITLRATGLAASQLPEIPQVTSDAIKTYGDQPQFDETKAREGFTGTRIETGALVPTAAGEYVLPPVRVTWWDTINNREQIAELPAQAIRVAAATTNFDNALSGSMPLTLEDDATSPAGDSGNTQLEFWFWPLVASNVLFAVLSLALIILLLVRPTSTQVKTDSGDEQASNNLNNLKQKVRKACAHNNAIQCKQALTHWGKAYFDLPYFAGLEELSRLCNCPKLAAELVGLDKILYGKATDSTWHGDTFWTAFNAYLKERSFSSPRQFRKSGSRELKPLYPN